MVLVLRRRGAERLPKLGAVAVRRQRWSSPSAIAAAVRPRRRRHVVQPRARCTATGRLGGRCINVNEALYLGTFTRAGGVLLGAALAMWWRPVAILRGPLRDKPRRLDLLALVGLVGLGAADLAAVPVRGRQRPRAAATTRGCSAAGSSSPGWARWSSSPPSPTGAAGPARCSATRCCAGSVCAATACTCSTGWCTRSSARRPGSTSRWEQFAVAMVVTVADRRAELPAGGDAGAQRPARRVAARRAGGAHPQGVQPPAHDGGDGRRRRRPGRLRRGEHRHGGQRLRRRPGVQPAVRRRHGPAAGERRPGTDDDAPPRRRPRRRRPPHAATVPFDLVRAAPPPGARPTGHGVVDLGRRRTRRPCRRPPRRRRPRRRPPRADDHDHDACRPRHRRRRARACPPSRPARHRWPSASR